MTAGRTRSKAARDARQISQPRSPSREPLLLGAVLVLAVALRAFGSGFGLPHAYHADEPIVVNHALAYGTGDLNPHFFKIPPLASYLLFFLYGAWFLLGRLSGAFASPQDFLELFLRDASAFYLLGRFALGVLPGACAVWQVWRLARRVGLREGALAAALGMAVAFLPVRDSHYIYADGLFVVALLAALSAVLTILERGAFWDYLWGGACVGLAAGAKYYGALVSLVLFCAHAVRMRRRARAGLASLFGSAKIWAAAAASILAFFLTTPYTFLDGPFFLKELAAQAQSEGAVGWLHHLRYSLREGIGLPLSIAALAGVLLSVARRDARRVLLVIYLVVFAATLSVFSQPHDRYVLPLVPVALVLAGAALETWVRRPVCQALALALLLSPTVLKDGHLLRLLVSPDVRTEAKAWIEAHLAPGTHFALEEAFFQPRLGLSREAVGERLAEARASGATRAQLLRLEALERVAQEPGWIGYRLTHLAREGDAPGFLLARPTAPYDLAGLRRRGVSHVLMLRLAPAHPQAGFLAELARQGKLLATFTPYRDPDQWSLEVLPRTGAPTRLEELSARLKLGERIELYEIRSSR